MCMKKNEVSQLAFIKKYVDENREQFNEDLFVRDEDQIIRELEKIILSCQRDKNFIIRVMSFEVVEDYNRINEILQQYEEIANRNRPKRINQFDYINLRESDIKLLIVKYYIKGKPDKPNANGGKGKEEEYLDVLIAIPRVVNKYYFRISGTLYSTMYQIVDGSTYNNLTSNNRKRTSITLKSYMPPIKVYQYMVNPIEDNTKEPMPCNLYQTIIFKKRFPGILYILAKLGFLEGMQFLGVADTISISDHSIKDENHYNFQENGIYVNVPKMMFDSDPMIQSITASLLKYFPDAENYEQIFSHDFWIGRLGSEFTNKKCLEKGNSLLDSIESIYDIGTREGLRLPIEQKDTVYHILRWMMREFVNLKQKNNLNIGYKKIRNPEYLSSLYSMKLCNGIYRIAGKGAKVKLSTLRSVIRINPMFLLRAITKCKLVNYRDLVNDLDAILALQFSYKGISGIGDNNKDTVPEVYKFIHPSQLGRLDPDSSHKSDPGMSGLICPLVDLYDKSFSDYKEPNAWEQNMGEMVDEYKKLTGMKDLLKFKKEILNIDTDKEKEDLDFDINQFRNLMPLLNYDVDDDVHPISIPLEESGTITYSIE